MANLTIDTLQKNKNIFNPQTNLQNQSYGIWDLTRSSVSYDNVQVKVSELFVVTQYYEMRPDLVAAIKLGDHSRMGSLLKMNGISNPFAIQRGTIMAIPTQQTVDDSFNTKKEKIQADNSNTNTNPNQAFRDNQEQKKFKVSEGRKKFLATKLKNPPAMTLPPNMLQPDQKTIERSQGFFIFAPDAGGGGLNQPED
jgi:hypothetical protein